MTLPVPVVEFYISGTWEKVTGPDKWLDLGSDGADIVITRGRANEQAKVSAGTCTFSLINDDGRFTLDNPAGFYGAGWKRWIPVRVTTNGTLDFTGYLSDSDTDWDDETGLHAHSVITCTDVLGMMAMSPVIGSWADTLINSLNPLYWWKLSDPQGSTSALGSAGGISLDAQVVHTTANVDAAPSDVVEFGVAGSEGFDTDTTVTLKGCTTDSPHYGKLAASVGVGALPISTTGITILVALQGTAWIKLALGSSIFDLTGSPNYTTGAVNLTCRELDGVNSPATVTVLSAGSNLQPSLFAVTLTSTSIGIVGGGTATRPAIRSSYTGALVSIESPYFDRDGSVAQLAILPGIMSSATLADLKAKLLGIGIGALTDWFGRAATAAGYPSAVTATYDRAMERPKLKGSNPAEVAASLSAAAGGVISADKSGSPKFWDFTYCPSWISIAVGEWERASSWSPDGSLYFSEVDFDGVWAATVPGAWPLASLDLPGLLPAADQAKFATYLANAAPIITGSRLSKIKIDLQSAANPAPYQAIDIRSRINLAGVPSQIPAGGVMTVEGYTLTIGLEKWTLELNTAPDPRFVMGDTISGVMASNYRISPF